MTYLNRPIDKFCPHCNKIFKALTANHTFCSPKCRTNNYYKRTRTRRLECAKKYLKTEKGKRNVEKIKKSNPWTKYKDSPQYKKSQRIANKKYYQKNKEKIIEKQMKRYYNDKKI